MNSRIDAPWRCGVGLQAKPFSFAATKIRIGRSRPSQQRKLVSDAAGRCRYGRSRRAILHRHDDCAASIPKSGLEIKNRCTQEGINRQNPASIPKSGLEITNRCTKEGVNGKSLHRFPSLGLKSRIDAGCSPFLSTRSTTRSSTRLALDLLHGAGSSWLRQWRQKRVLMRPEAAFP